MIPSMHEYHFAIHVRLEQTILAQSLFSYEEDEISYSSFLHSTMIVVNIFEEKEEQM